MLPASVEIELMQGLLEIFSYRQFLLPGILIHSSRGYCKAVSGIGKH